MRTRVTGVDVVRQLAFGELEVLLWNDLVEGEFAAVDYLARIAMAINARRGVSVFPIAHNLNVD